MIPKEQIDHVKQEADIVAVFESLGIELRRSGSTYNCLCPVHNEKTPSCHIFPRTNTWKCFGCGAGGNAVDIVLKKKGCSFVEALQYVADVMHYTLTDDYEENEASRIAREKKDLQISINKDAMIWFQIQLRQSPEAIDYIKSRKWKSETIDNWSIGYAPNDFVGLWNYLRDKGYRSDDLADSSLFSRSKKNGKFYSFFNDRIMFPIMNNNHEPIAFTGRALHYTKGCDFGKYLNSTKSDLYIKGQTFFGFDVARSEIFKQHCAVLVEGNPDVIKLHEIGITNTIAACGTAFTTEHAKILAKITKSVILIYDNDNGGQGAIIKTAPILINEGIVVWVLPLPKQETKIDPDEFFISQSQFEEYDRTNRRNVFEYLADENKKRCEEPTAASDFAREMSRFLIKLDDVSMATHIDSLSKIIPTKKMWNEAVKLAKRELLNDPKRLDELGYTQEQVGMINEYGFFEQEHSYKIQPAPDAAGHYVSNFVLEPLFHIESTVNAKRLYRLTNNRGIVKELEISQKDLVSLSAFKLRVESFGNFLFEGGESDLNKIKRYLYEHTKTCKEVEQLGWQREGFWAWSNGIISPSLEWTKLDELGIVQYGEHWYYLPALSKFFENDTQLFQYERRFIHQDSNAELFTLTDKMMRVYGDNAVVGIAYYLSTLFRDVIFGRFNSFPILNIFGQKGTGKTEMAITLLKLFGNHGDGLNMTNSTLPAMADHVSHARNALVHIDEYKNSVEPDKVEFLKGLYDGTGRSRMNMDKDKKKEMTPVDCGVILTGQEMPTIDNALFSRVLYLTVSKTVFTAEQNQNYEDLKKYEKQGLTCITNKLLKLRHIMVETYEEHLKATKEEIKQATNTRVVEGRILQNWTMVLAVLRTLDNHLGMSFSYKTALPIFVKGIELQNASVKNSNEISNFWKAFESMVTDATIEKDYDFKLELGNANTKVTKGSGSNRQDFTYTQTLDVLYVNPSRVFNLHAKLCKSIKDNRVGLMNEESLRHYLTTQDEYLGTHVMSFKTPIKNMQNPFEAVLRNESGRIVQSPHKTARALVFNYKKLVEEYGIDLNITLTDDFGEAPEMPY